MKRVALLFLAAGCGGKPTPVGPPAAPAPRAVAARAATPAPAKSCGLESAILAGDRVGAVRLGMPADSVKALCIVARDTTEMPEGQPTRMLVVVTGGDTLRATLEEGKVYSVVVESPRFKVADSLHAGMPLSRVLGLPKLTGGRGEYGLYVWSDEPATCGISFLVRFSGRDPMLRTVNRETLEPYATTARITQALVRGCDR